MEQVDRTYKFVDSSDTTANFVPANVANLIFNLPKKDAEKFVESSIEKGIIQNEFGVGSPQSKNQKSIDGKVMIKEVCWKLEIDSLGNVINVSGMRKIIS
jgi:CRISPR-associated endonuclease Csn1